MSDKLRSVNIPMQSSAENLREDLDKIAKSRAVSTSRIVAQIYTYAIQNMGSYPNQIDNPREKPGKHISTKLPEAKAEELTNWAKSLGRSRAHHCCFILEYTVSNEDLRKTIFN